jgi:hypothetical protein
MSALLATDEIDLALTYDYDLAPIAFDATVEATRLWSVAWSLEHPNSRSRTSPATPWRCSSAFAITTGS